MQSFSKELFGLKNPIKEFLISLLKLEHFLWALRKAEHIRKIKEIISKKCHQKLIAIIIVYKTPSNFQRNIKSLSLLLIILLITN
jgi:hypothetical protein